jgi:type II secretion system protein N
MELSERAAVGLGDSPGKTLFRLINRDFIRRHAIQIAYGAAGAILFVTFLFATFPYADALSGVLQPMGLRLGSRESGISFPIGIKMTGVSLDSVIDGRSVFQSDQLRISPSLLSMLIGSPGVKVHADAYGGKLELRARRSGDATSLSFSGSDLLLERYTALRTLGLNLGGVLSGDGDLLISQQGVAADHGEINLSGADALFRLFPGSPPIKIGKLVATIKLDKGKLTLEKMESHGGDLTISGRGVIELEPYLPDSGVAIRFQLETTPVARAQLGILLNFLPHPPNATPYFVHGTLGAPALS